MPPELQKTALEFIVEAMTELKVEKDISTQIKRKMDQADHGSTWHCIIGKEFGASVCFENKALLFVHANDGHILLFKSCDQIS